MNHAYAKWLDNKNAVIDYRRSCQQINVKHYVIWFIEQNSIHRHLCIEFIGTSNVLFIFYIGQSTCSIHNQWYLLLCFYVRFPLHPHKPKTSVRTTIRCFPESQVTLCFSHNHILLEILFCHKNEPILGFFGSIWI